MVGPEVVSHFTPVRRIEDTPTARAAVEPDSETRSRSKCRSFIHPRGHERGWGAVAKNFYGVTMGDTFSERKLEIFGLFVHEDGDHAWDEFYWRFDAIMR